MSEHRTPTPPPGSDIDLELIREGAAALGRIAGRAEAAAQIHRSAHYDAAHSELKWAGLCNCGNDQEQEQTTPTAAEPAITALAERLRDTLATAPPAPGSAVALALCRECREMIWLIQGPTGSREWQHVVKHDHHPEPVVLCGEPSTDNDPACPCFAAQHDPHTLNAHTNCDGDGCGTCHSCLSTAILTGPPPKAGLNAVGRTVLGDEPEPAQPFDMLPTNDGRVRAVDLTIGTLDKANDKPLAESLDVAAGIDPYAIPANRIGVEQ